MKSALYQEPLQRYQLKCTLCPHYCIIGDGKAGRCHVRENIKGDLFLKTYGIVSSMNFDPIEKKPLYHFFPGKYIFSIGSYGCNLKCRFCQNWEISQSVPENLHQLKHYSPEELVAVATQRKDNIGIAYTYNEPIVWFEYMADIARLAKKKNLKNVMITNGFINPEPLSELLGLMDAFNVDLKAFTEDFYRTQTLSTLEPVKNTLLQIRQSGKHLEITNLIIPGLNDQKNTFSEMVKWIAGKLGQDTILHLSRYFPNYRLNQSATPYEKLTEFYEIAKQHLNYVYLGNVGAENEADTRCPTCGNLLISRTRYDAHLTGIDKHNSCMKCGTKIPGDFRL
ncbi:MAG TPA: AmmeMemoRadiSam system radical SAM enzyme [Bacteroidales bacterium]|nr:AmmeMemoRadiSam system radical SAM enzyme [Bacteroidales bacterium]